MQVLMDIDGTIAYQDDTQFAQMLWQALSLPPDDRPQQARMAEVLALPPVSAARDRMGEKRFRMIVSMIQQSESAILSRLVLPGAQEALHQLAQIGQIQYCTARKASYSGKNITATQAIDAINERMQQATYRWLEQHGFPCSDQVIFCRGAAGKLEAIATGIHESGDVILVENEVDAISAAFADLTQEAQAQIAAHATVIAFGKKHHILISPPSTLRCFALSAWDQLDEVLRALNKGEKDGARWTRQKQPIASQKT